MGDTRAKGRPRKRKRLNEDICVMDHKTRKREKEELVNRILKEDRLVLKLVRLEDEKRMRELKTISVPSPRPSPKVDDVSAEPVFESSSSTTTTTTTIPTEDKPSIEKIVDCCTNDPKSPIISSSNSLRSIRKSNLTKTNNSNNNNINNVDLPECKVLEPIKISNNSMTICNINQTTEYHKAFENFIANREAFIEPPQKPQSHMIVEDEDDKKVMQKVEPIILRRKTFSCSVCLKKFAHSKELKKHVKLFHSIKLHRYRQNNNNNNNNRVVIKITKTDESNREYRCLVDEQHEPIKIKIKTGKIVDSSPEEIKESFSSDLQADRVRVKKRGRRRKSRSFSEAYSTEPDVKEMLLGEVLKKTPHNIIFKAAKEEDDNVTNGQESGYLSNQMTSLDSDDEDDVVSKPKIIRKRRLSSSSESVISSEVEEQQQQQVQLKNVSVVLRRIPNANNSKLRIKSIQTVVQPNLVTPAAPIMEEVNPVKPIIKLQRVMNALSPWGDGKYQEMPLTILITDVSYLPQAVRRKNMPQSPPLVPQQVTVFNGLPPMEYVCSACIQMREIVNRMEVSMDMSTFDESEEIRCPLCPGVFQSLDYLEFHISKEHLRCENERECQQSRKHSLSIPTHESATESEVYVGLSLKCKCCYELIESVQSLNAHVKAKHGNLVTTCNKDGSPSLRALRKNYQPKFEPAADEIFTCLLCKNTFVMREEVFDHLLEEHQIGCKFSCQQCLTSFRTPEAQESHKCVERNLSSSDRILTIARNYVPKEDDNENETKVNGNVFPEVPAPQEIMFNGRKDGQKGRKKCPMCFKRYRHRENFQEHLKREHGCSKSKAEKLSDELLPQSSEEDNSENWDKNRSRTIINNNLSLGFSCKRCLKEFSNIMDLKEHRLTQHKKGEKPFPCPKCQKTFSSVGLLRKHRVYAHDEQLPMAPPEESSVKIDKRTKQWREAVKARKAMLEQQQQLATSDSDQNLECVMCDLRCESTVTLKNHMKNDHKCAASVCQLCNKLISDESRVIRHMLDLHITPSNLEPKIVTPKGKSSLEKDVDELLVTLGKERLYSLLVYHDFEGRLNSETMKCPGCSQTFANSHSCKHHYVHSHEKLCLLCDEVFRSGENLSRHNIEQHKAVATYFWCIQMINNSIIKSLALDEDSNSLALYEELLQRLNYLESGALLTPVDTPEPFTEEVFTEDQLPDPGIEVVIGREEVEDDLLGMLNFSPNYEGFNKVGLSIEDFEKEVSTVSEEGNSTNSGNSIYASGFYWHKFENGNEEQVLVITQEDELSFRDDLETLAKKIRSTNESLSLDEIQEMLTAYFQNKNNFGVNSASA